jgi:hypothetical protein
LITFPLYEGDFGIGKLWHSTNELNAAGRRVMPSPAFSFHITQHKKLKHRMPSLILNHYDLIPNKMPTRVVNPSDSAPQNNTRIVGLNTCAPPDFAPTTPNTANEKSVLAITAMTIMVRGARMATIRGKHAPTIKLAAEANAACIGLAVVILEIPNSSWACAPKT